MTSDKTPPSQSLEGALSQSLRATHEMFIDLEAARAGLELLFHELEDVCCLLTAEGEIVWGNESTARLLQVDRESLDKAKLESAVVEANRAKFREAFARISVEASETVAFESPMAVGDAAPREYSWHIRPFHGISLRRGQVYIAIGRDMTDFLRERLGHERLQTEISTAQIVQHTFLASLNQQTAHVAIAGFYRPAARCSGDWWTFKELDANRSLVAMADVTGHGTGAAIVTAMIHSFVQAYVKLLLQNGNGAPDHWEPKNIVHFINQSLANTSGSMTTATFAVYLIDHRSQTLKYSRAGHPAGIFLTSEQGSLGQAHSKFEVSTSSKKRMVILNAHSSDFIGFNPDVNYTQETIAFKPGDRLIVFTDGLIERYAPPFRAPGGKTMRTVIAEHAELPREAFIEALTRPLQEVRKIDLERDDDITVLVIDRI